MLPICRTENNLYSLPKFNVEVADIENFINELRNFPGEFKDCFFRSEPRGQFFNYMVGQFSILERKSIELMAINIDGADIRSMQRYISDDSVDLVQNWLIFPKIVVITYCFCYVSILGNSQNRSKSTESVM